ncbi:MAG: sugar kinase [Pseudomonadota bacterium]|nr:sugar kinase [Pseudomonadota bacterium]
MQQRQTVFVIGECMIELRRGAAGLSYGFGGDTLNTAVYLSRLIDRTRFEVAYVSALGTDTFSDEMCTSWAAEGIVTEWVQRLPDKLPGLYLIETDAGGERSFHYWRDDSAARYWLQGPRVAQVREALAHAPFTYLSGISLAILGESHRELLLETLAQSRARGGKIIFDSNFRPRLWQGTGVAADVHRRVLALTDIALLSLDDERTLHGPAEVAEVIARVRALGVPEVVVKRGAASCIVQAEGVREEVAPPRVASVVDTTAAGDSFGAAYLAARLAGHSATQAARAGHRVAATVIQHQGAIIPPQNMPRVFE